MDRRRQGHRKGPLPARAFGLSLNPFPKQRNKDKQFLEELRDVFPHLVFPVRPIVAALRAPIVQRVADAFAGENFLEAVSRATVLPWTRTSTEGNGTGRDLAKKPGVA